MCLSVSSLGGSLLSASGPADSTIGDVVSFCLQIAQKFKFLGICMKFLSFCLDFGLSRLQILTFAGCLARSLLQSLRLTIVVVELSLVCPLSF